MGGLQFTLEDDTAILGINSPRASVGGPYLVVHKNMEERYAIVALDWNGVPSLAIRWFWGIKGNPVSTGHATWFVYPSSLTYNLLSGLPLDYRLRSRIDKFLDGEISGNDI